MNPRSAIFHRTGLLFIVVTIFVGVSHAATYKRLYNFAGGVDGSESSSQLVFDTSGSAYGTTASGGLYDLGTVFAISPAGEEQILWSFDGAEDGSDPHGGVILDAAGNLYGTTVAGGSGFCGGDGCGIVFELSSSGGNWNLLPLYQFTGLNDGYGPGSPLVFDNAGNLYGTAPDGGKYGYGVVFELSPAENGWKQKLIHTFTGKKEGGIGSLGSLLLDADGNLYGTTEVGGPWAGGSVYELSPTDHGPWKISVLYDFKVTPDAAGPYGGLIFDSVGNLYGTTYFGGQYGYGTVFQLSRGLNGAWQENILYSFQGVTDGSYPTATLLFDGVSTLFGTTQNGGRPSCDCGTVFSLKFFRGEWLEKLLHRFGKGRDGSYPIYGLTFDPSGNFRGTTPAGGTAGEGTIFLLTR